MKPVHRFARAVALPLLAVSASIVTTMVVVVMAQGNRIPGLPVDVTKGPIDMKLNDPVLVGAIDIHSHLDPDSQDNRAFDVIDAAKMAKARGMRGFVVKTHTNLSSAASAYFARKEVPGVEVFGRFAMNLATGGINPASVIEFTQTKGGWGRIVEMPTRDSKVPAKENRPGVLPWVDLFPTYPRVVSTIRGGEVLPEVKNLITLLSRIKTPGSNGRVVLATGHATAEEHVLIAREARRQGVPVLVTHSERLIPVPQMQELAKLGAYIEVNAGMFKTGEETEPQVRDAVQTIRDVGAESVIMGTDCGQVHSPFPADCMALAARELRARGISEHELDLMMKVNPARLLGLPLLDQKPATK